MAWRRGLPSGIVPACGVKCLEIESRQGMGGSFLTGKKNDKSKMFHFDCDSNDLYAPTQMDRLNILKLQTHVFN
jgi:hypothetical protein